jgi:dTDP-4-dehydrorhamnose reductase
MRILIVGKTGQVGRELARASWPDECEVIQFGRTECDLTDCAAVRRALVDQHPDFVVNAAAYTAVDRAESEPELAEKVNCAAPAAMAEVCEGVRACLIHLSTDYVFDGLKRCPYLEHDQIAPRSVYGRTKAAGETAVRQRVERHVILRTSWVFAAHGSNFVRTMLRLSGQRTELRVVDDQFGAPTAACDIAGAIVAVVSALSRRSGVYGTYHFTSADPTTWYGFARTIFELSSRETNLVPIATAEYKTPARRPSNSVLDCGRIACDYGIAQPSWRLALAGVLKEMSGPACTPGSCSQ